MSQEQAVALVKAKRTELNIDREMRPVSAEKAVVWAHRGDDGSQPGTDRVAWIVTLSSRFGWVRVDVDDSNGAVLAVQRSL